MNHKQIQQQVWQESKQYIDRGEDCNNAPLYIKIGNLFTKYQSKEHWKNPFTAVVTNEEDREWLKAAIEWYHGSEPLCDESPLTKGVWYVSSIGYVC